MELDPECGSWVSSHPIQAPLFTNEIEALYDQPEFPKATSPRA